MTRWVAGAFGLLFGSFLVAAPVDAADAPGAAQTGASAARAPTGGTGPRLAVEGGGAEGGRGALPSSDLAASSETIVPKQRVAEKSFYGWQILATGEVAALIVAASVILPERPLSSLPSTAGFVAGMPAYLISGPAVHWSHGDFPKGLVSLGGNVAFAGVGGLIGGAIHCASKEQGCDASGFFTGLAIGALLAPLVDAAVLGWENLPVGDVYVGGMRRPVARRPPGKYELSFAPTWTVGSNGSVELGLAGRF